MMNIATFTVAAAFAGGTALVGAEAISFATDYSSMQKSAIRSMQRGEIGMQSSQALMRKVCIDAAIVLRTQGQDPQIDCKSLMAAAQ